MTPQERQQTIDNIAKLRWTIVQCHCLEFILVCLILYLIADTVEGIARLCGH